MGGGEACWGCSWCSGEVTPAGTPPAHPPGDIFRAGSPVAQFLQRRNVHSFCRSVFPGPLIPQDMTTCWTGKVQQVGEFLRCRLVSRALDPAGHDNVLDGQGPAGGRIPEMPPGFSGPWCLRAPTAPASGCTLPEDSIWPTPLSLSTARRGSQGSDGDSSTHAGMHSHVH